MALHDLTYADFKLEVGKRLAANQPGASPISKATIDAVFKAFIEETVDCLSQGYKVSIPGLVKFGVAYVPAKRKGEMVIPFGGGEPQPRAESVPAGFRAKAYASSAIKKAFPKMTAKAGKELAALVKPPEKVAAAKSSKGASAKGGK